MRHTLSVLVENKFGVLARIAGMFSGRGYNIDSLNVGPTGDPAVSRMTIVVSGEDATIEQVTKLLHKLVDVVSVQNFLDGEYVDRELVLLQVRTTDVQRRAEVIQFCEIFRAKIINTEPDCLTIEITGSEGKLEKFIRLMGDYEIAEVTRTGKVALPRI